MANYSIDDLKVLSETDLFSIMSKSDYSSVNEENSSWKYLTKTYFNNSKQLKSSISNIFIKDHSFENYYKNLPGARTITMNQMLKAQNTNGPWLFNILKKKFYRSRKYKNNRKLIEEIDSNNTAKSLAEELLEKPISNNGTSRKWIVNEKEIVSPLIKNFGTSISGQYNVSRAMSSSTSPILHSTNDSLHLHHYHYDFQPTISSSSSVLIAHEPQISSMILEETEQNIINNQNTPIDFTSIASVVKTYYTTNRPQIDSQNIQEIEMSSTSPSTLPATLEPITEDVHLISGNSTTQTTSKRAKSASAAAARNRRRVNSRSTKRGRGRLESTKKKKSKYYQEHLLSSEEIELREALRIIDLDNIGFFPPNELRKVLKEIGIHSNDIEKIQQCLPLDEDGHYSIDNLIKLFLGTK